MNDALAVVVVGAFAFLLFTGAFDGISIFHPEPSPTPHPTPTYHPGGGGGGGGNPTPSPTPQISPTPTPFLGQNYAVIPNDWGYFWEFGYFVFPPVINPQIFAYRTDIQHNGHNSIEIKGPAVPTNGARELGLTYNRNFTNLAVSPGDHVVFSAWIKMDHSTIGHDGNEHYGGIIGLDLYYDDNHRVWEYAAGTTTQFSYNEGFSYTLNYNWIPYGSDWTFTEVNLVIPSKFFSQDDYGHSLGGSFQIASIAPWLSVTCYGINGYLSNTDGGSAYFAETSLYIVRAGG